jgi:DNA replication protein DnaD
MMTDAFKQRRMATFDQKQRSVLENAAGFLTPPQIEALKKMQEQMRTLTETSMKMSNAMMGN